MDSDNEIKYCVVAYIDLQGFSSHLEVGNDIRTFIGKKAIERLKTLEEAEIFLKNERDRESLFFYTTRINDSLIVSMDLNDALLPGLGETIRDSYTEDEFASYYDYRYEHNREGNFHDAYSRKRKEYTKTLIKFIGLISRAYLSISQNERQHNFPGAKATISTGFRRPFIDVNGKEEFLSANFAFSNAYLAQEKLKGAMLFIDNNIYQMLDANQQIINIAKLSCLQIIQPLYSPLNNDKIVDLKWLERKHIEVILFRKSYFFRETTISPLTYLQFLDELDSQKFSLKSVIEEVNEINLDKRIEQGEIFTISKFSYDMNIEEYERENIRQF